MFHCLWLTPTGVCGCSGGDKIALKCGLKLWKKVFGLGLIWLSSYTYMYVVCRCWEEEGLVEHTVWIKKLLETTWLDLTWLNLTQLNLTWLNSTRLWSWRHTLCMAQLHPLCYWMVFFYLFWGSLLQQNWLWSFSNILHAQWAKFQQNNL